MGCVASRFEREEEVVSICRERKQQLKLAVERRYALSDAHFRYCKSLYGVSAALNLFVSRHSEPPSPFYITFPPPSPKQQQNGVVSNPLFLQQTPTEPTKEAIQCGSCSSYESSEEECEEVDEKDEGKEQVCGYFYMDNNLPNLSNMSNTMSNMQPSAMSMSMSMTPGRDFGWDFFNPFENVSRPEVIDNVYNRISEEDVRVVREQEGIPELEDDEEEGEKVAEDKHKEENVVERGNGGEVVESERVEAQQEEKRLSVIDTPVRGRELLEALKDVEDHFVRAYEAGKDLSRMLECNRVHLQSNLDEIKENSTKVIRAISWRSPSSRSSSCKSLVESGSKSSSTWTEFSNDLFDDYGGMVSGSHSLTLGRLYAWEKKLYEDVKDGDAIRRIYEKKCNHLRDLDVKTGEGLSVDKTRAAVKDLYSRILVAIRSAETISNNIEKLIDEELEPQIMELLQGLMRTWKIMLESHEIQNKIIFEVKTYTCPSYGKFCNESHRLATLQLEVELMNWRSCFMEYVVAQKGYIEALHGWLSKFVPPDVENHTRGRAPVLNGPPLLPVCRDWLRFMNNIPDKSVSYAIKSCAKDVRALWLQQGAEQQQKRKVDSLSKELDKKMLSLQKVENRLEFRLTDKNEPDIEHGVESLTEKKDMLENFKIRVEFEKEKHQKLMQETEKMILNGFQTGFCRVFESMTEYSRAALKMYNELSTREKTGKESSCIEGAEMEGNGSGC